MQVPTGFHFHDQAPDQPDPLPELVRGLTTKPRSIAPKFFYDEAGSRLFTEITRLPEYYPTRTEIGILQRYAGDISRLVGSDFTLIEYGSGSSEKVGILLEQLKPSVYAPIDISREYLHESSLSLARQFPWLEVHAICADFTAPVSLPFTARGRRIGFFPGSSIGNFSRDDAADFLARIRHTVGDEGGLLLGVDLKKDTSILNAAYNDARGVTAAFNLNILTHLNREFGSDFDLEAFRHLAFYNEPEGTIQMFLVSRKDQEAYLAGERISLEEEEVIHTENSNKYSVEEVCAMAAGAGFSQARHWTDEDGLFAVFYLSD